MKLIIEFYRRTYRCDAHLVDTKDLKGEPKVIKIHLDHLEQPTNRRCPPKHKTV